MTIFWKKILHYLLKKEVEKTDPTMKYLIAGLGNMHPDYDDTRHNIGFDVLDALAQEHELTFENDRLGDLALLKHRGRQLYLLKPSTYMNRSGKSVRHWLLKKKVPLENLMVIVDDVNLDLGIIRIRGKGSDGGHNGLKDIQQELGGAKYARMRIGIGKDFPKGRQADFVLGQWTQEEKEKLKPSIEKAGKAIKDFAFHGLSRVMNQYNG